MAQFDAPKRTTIPKIVVKQSPTGKLWPERHTRVLHSVGGKAGLKALNGSEKCPSDCYTTVLHSRHVGLWRRGAVYQYRVRVPHALVGVLGKREINRSLQTTSFNDAVRAVRKIAFDIETYFSRVHDGQSAVDASNLLDERPTFDAIENAAMWCGLDRVEISKTMASAWNFGIRSPRMAPERPVRLSSDQIKRLDMWCSLKEEW